MPDIICNVKVWYVLKRGCHERLSNTFEVVYPDVGKAQDDVIDYSMSLRKCPFHQNKLARIPLSVFGFNSVHTTQSICNSSRNEIVHIRAKVKCSIHSSAMSKEFKAHN